MCRRTFIPALILLLVTGSTASAQPTAAWVQKRISELLADQQMDRRKDVEAPSIARGTSLVDKTEAPDLVSLAMSLYNAGNDDDGKAPVTMTLSGWALRNAVTQENPLDPAVYSKGGNWRRWSVTVGREMDEGTTSAAQVLGAKVLVWNGRDVSTVAHRDRLTELNGLLMAAAPKWAVVIAKVNDYLFRTLRTRVDPLPSGASEAEQKVQFLNAHLSAGSFDTTLGLLTQEERAGLDVFLPALIEADTALRERVATMIAAVRGAPQLAVTYQARLREDTAPDEQRWEAAFDYGPTTALLVALNGSYDLKKTKNLADERGGRLSGELTWVVMGRRSRNLSVGEMLHVSGRARSRITLSAAGEVQWRSSQSSVRKIQAKVMIPIPALKGLTLPVSVTYANDPDLIDEHDVRGQVGFTVDFSQVKRAFTSAVR